ncbi:hypothetical protein E2C01_032805 [Portunus trituberculatus]|uniref:Uncharacterized protein n=1 Tax=Portunus trituberculatus TaxID=210409 RepID=A0A5B7F3V6_PORTR|nr:hypothetical protein [Portunus trituberculatus]
MLEITDAFFMNLLFIIPSSTHSLSLSIFSCMVNTDSESQGALSCLWMMKWLLSDSQTLASHLRLSGNRPDEPHEPRPLIREGLYRRRRMRSSSLTAPSREEEG